MRFLLFSGYDWKIGEYNLQLCKLHCSPMDERLQVRSDVFLLLLFFFTRYFLPRHLYGHPGCPSGVKTKPYISSIFRYQLIQISNVILTHINDNLFDTSDIYLCICHIWHIHKWNDWNYDKSMEQISCRNVSFPTASWTWGGNRMVFNPKWESTSQKENETKQEATNLFKKKNTALKRNILLGAENVKKNFDLIVRVWYHVQKIQDNIVFPISFCWKRR